jgi:hypothetical protein
MKRNVEKVWDARYTLGARYLPKNTVKAFLFLTIFFLLFQCTSICVHFTKPVISEKENFRLKNNLWF